MISPATGHVDTEWFDVFWDVCLLLECRFDYIATHLYTGTVDERMDQLKAYAQRLFHKLFIFIVEESAIYTLFANILGAIFFENKNFSD